MASAKPILFETMAQSLAQPLGWPARFGVAAILLTVGSLYCLGNVALVGGTGQWLRAIAWSLGAILPWFALFEFIKAREQVSGTKTGAIGVVLLIGLTSIASLAIEGAIDQAIWHSESAPLGLQILRRFPPVATFVVLLFATRLRVPAAVDGEIEIPMSALIPGVMFVRAADNYLEFHAYDRTVMRRQTLESAARALSSEGFVRIHRSILVNQKAIVRVDLRGKRGVVELRDGRTLPVGSRYEWAIRHLAT